VDKPWSLERWRRDDGAHVCSTLPTTVTGTAIDTCYGATRCRVYAGLDPA